MNYLVKLLDVTNKKSHAELAFGYETGTNNTDLDTEIKKALSVTVDDSKGNYTDLEVTEDLQFIRDLFPHSDLVSKQLRLRVYPIKGFDL